MNQHRSTTFDELVTLSCLPYGVAHGEEGVCLLVRMGPHRILLDCGLSDISELESLSAPPADLLLCSHAHTDHAQGLLALHQAFPQMPIYASEVTTELLPLNWQELNRAEIPQFCQALPWRSPVEFCDGLSAELFPAGHLPGAAAILLTYKNPEQERSRAYKLLYTGDFSVSNSRLVDGLSIESLRGLAPDVLIIEGSYGTARHPRRRQQEKQLMERIDRAIANSQSVLLPVPSLGLGQEILMLLRSHHQFTGRDLDIWVDATVAIGCDAYLELLPHFPASVQNFARHQPLFWDDRVRPRVRRLSPENRSNIGQSPCIVLTDYATQLREFCHPESGSWLILLHEHPRLKMQPDPRQIFSLASEIRTLGSPNSNRLRIETYLLAQHSDGLNTTQLIHNLRPQHVIFVHGSPAYLADLTSLEELQNRYQLHSPRAGTLVELPIGDNFIQPAAPLETHYEGELNELADGVKINLPDSLTTDPRWNNFADTGLVEARWQGEELVLRGLSQRELLTQTSNAKMPIDIDCCGNCRHQRGQRCCNQASPLYGFKVTPEGYCPVYEPADPQNET
ncbi:MBL fold metallo-hydrolase [Oscillatoria salina]|uniref:MBL fold metallo-hydrolase n=1 Tax=Oscillatoria salina TaxID=331517 RepID=UPI0013B6582D|nr:MBL fold metallo-hydrolase [Oscillatoria salina]MBZ8183026.1 MBL fold metallo-hydrolase [Oscillatoria salina IIICB1]NET86613.1 MBL fold metallo-hydrolase [Kamptonema sp. SIO1D9]